MEKKGLYQTAHTKVCFRNVVSCGRCASTFYYIDCQRSNECCNYNMIIIFHDRKVTICDFRVYTSFAMKEGYRVDFVRYVEFRVHPGAPNSYVWCWFAYILSPLHVPRHTNLLLYSVCSSLVERGWELRFFSLAATSWTWRQFYAHRAVLYKKWSGKAEINPPKVEGKHIFGRCMWSDLRDSNGRGWQL